MKKNIGTTGRILRLVTALVLFGLSIWKSSLILFGIALFVLFESMFSWCVVNSLLGKSSCPINNNISNSNSSERDDSKR